MERELRQLDEEVRQNTLEQPTASDVGAFWSEFVELWPEWTDAEKVEMIGHVVKSVEVRQKDSVFLELSSIGGKRCLSSERKFLTNQEWERG